MCSVPASTSCWGTEARRAATLFAVALCLFIAVAPAGAQVPSISIRVAGPADISAVTHETLTIALLVANNGTVDRTLVIETALPEGWKSITSGGAFTIAPAADDLRLIGILVPSAAAAGPHLLEFIMRDVDGTGEGIKAQLTVTVRAQPRLDIQILDRPAIVVAGSEYTARFLLSNSGNTDVRPGLTYTENLGLHVNIEADQGTLAPGEQRTITLTVQSDSGIHSSVLHQLTLKATDLFSGGDPGDTAAPPAVGTSSYEVEIVPLSVAGDVPVHSLRLDNQTIGTTGYAQGLNGLLEESLSLHGTLDEKGENFIEADIVKELATGIDPLFGPLDRYAFSWKHPLGSATLGDGIFNLSPLLATDLNGRGVQAFFTPPGLRFGGMYYSDPWSGSAEQWVGATAGANFPMSLPAEESIYDVNAGFRSSLTNNATFGLWQTLKPIPGVKLQLDTALQSIASGEISPALFAEASASFEGFSADILFLRAWPDFSAQYHDTQMLQAVMAANLLGDALSVAGSFSWSDANLRRDPLLANADRTITAGVQVNGYVAGWGSRPSLGIQVISQQDLLPSPDYHWMDTLFRASWQQQIGALSLSTLSSVDRKLDFLGDLSATTLADEVTFTWQATGALGFFASLQYDGKLPDAGINMHSAGGSMGARAASAVWSLDGTLHSTVTFSSEGLAGILAGLTGSASHALPWGASIWATTDVAVSVDPTGWKPVVSLSITYGGSADIAIYRTRDSAVVRGMVFDQATGAPRSGVVLRLSGLATVSDAKGAYLFNLAKSGTWYLQVDRASLGETLIPSEPTPIEVTVLPGVVTVVDIGIVERASLSGTVTVWDYPQGGTYDASALGDNAPAERQRLGGIANIVVELSDGVQVLRRVTNRDGIFQFTEVRPGRYTLTVIGGPLPDYHHVEQTTYQVELTPGQTGDVAIRVLQERRRIQMETTPVPDVVGAPLQ